MPIPKADAEHMENYVESVHPARSHNKKKSNPSTDELALGVDGYEGPLRVPTCVPSCPHQQEDNQYTGVILEAWWK